MVRAWLTALFLTLGLALATLGSAWASGWPPTERIVTYSVSGADGRAIYDDIGRKGPRITEAQRPVIAHMTFDLKWGRDYKKTGAGCVLTRVQPFLTITYTLPKAEGVSGELARKWQVFAAGIEVHERQHGAYARMLAEEILAQTRDLTTASDNANCDGLRAAVQVEVADAFSRYKARNLEFETREMSAGGNVHQLILGLVQ
ncbi:MAG: DUF922 domain-containing protein [Pseudomonadota bacterium]